jgi:RNA polymerase sigma factor (sigma-70 family)
LEPRRGNSWRDPLDWSSRVGGKIRTRRAAEQRAASYRETTPPDREDAAVRVTESPSLASVRRWLARAEADAAADADLLRRFAQDRDEVAFGALVDRHGPMALGVARRVTGDHHAAEDILQAVFLQLARSAGSFRRPAAVAAWLHRTTYRLALTALRARRRRQRAEGGASARPSPDPLADLSARELLAALDEELRRLPEAFRLPLVLCCLEGRSVEEAAAQLGQSTGSVRGRLARGRRRLEARLARRGLTFAAGAGAPLLLATLPAVATEMKEAVLSAAAGRVCPPPVIATLAASRTRAVVAWTWAAAAAALLGLAGLGFGLLTPGDPKKSKPAPPAVADDVWEYSVTYNGKPVAGAKVGATPYTYPAYTYPASGEATAGQTRFATTDDAGSFRVPKDIAAPGATVMILARDQAGRGGYGMLYGDNKHPPTVELHDGVELTGRLTDVAGRPVAGLKLRPVALGPDSFGRFDGRMVKLADTPDWFWDSFPVRLKADGSFTVTGVPVGYSVSVRFETEGFGSGRLWVMPGRPVAVKLDKAGSVAVHFTPPADDKPGDVRVQASRQADSSLVEVSAEATSDRGEVTLRGLPPGTYDVTFPYTGPAQFFPKAIPPVTVKAGETAAVATVFEPAARVTATLVDSKTGKGIAGAGISASAALAHGRRAYVPKKISDAAGRVELLMPAGVVSVTPAAADGYAVGRFTADPSNQFSSQPLPVASGQARDFGKFPLVPTADLSGTVSDEAGKPVAGAEVSVGYTGSNIYGGGRVVTDAQGAFVLKGVNPEGGVFGVTARQGKRITSAPVAVDPAKQDGVIRVVISERFAARVRARAVDRAGRPVAGASVELAHSVQYLERDSGTTGFGIGMGAGVTDADGRFESDTIQPGDQYSVAFSAPGFRGAATDTWVAKPGEAHEFGELCLTRANLAVKGTVTSPGGEPVVGATVFTNADGPRPAAATTDAAGRFTLTGLREGTAYVSVKAEGLRVVSAPAEPGGPDLAIRLRRQSDPPAPPPTIPDAHRAATAKLTRHLLERMWAERARAGDDGKLVLRAMIRTDFETAKQWAAEEKARTGGKVNLSPLLDEGGGGRPLIEVARDDPEEAVALLRSAGGAEGFRTLCGLAGQQLPDAPRPALRLAEEAVTRARGMDQSARPWALAQAGELVYRAGKEDAGRKLIEEAAKLAEPLGHDGMGGFTRGMVACRVVLYDPAKARQMIDPIRDPREFNRWLAQACVRLAERDLSLAKKWLDDFRPDNSFAKHSSRQLMAYRLAARDPDEAVKLAESIEDRTLRVLTLAGLAPRIALKDRGRAVKLIDATLDAIVANPTGYYVNNAGGGGTAALVMYRARQAGHPDLAGVRDRVLAARSAPPDNGPFNANMDAGVRVALALALTDPVAARAILAQALPSAEYARLDGLRDRDKLVALALADPEGAVRVVDPLLERAIKAKRGYQFTGLNELAVVLTEPERLSAHVQRYGGLVWEFEEE